MLHIIGWSIIYNCTIFILYHIIILLHFSHNNFSFLVHTKPDLKSVTDKLFSWFHVTHWYSILFLIWLWFFELDRIFSWSDANAILAILLLVMSSSFFVLIRHRQWNLFGIILIQIKLFGWKLSRWELSYNQFIQCIIFKQKPNSEIGCNLL